MLEVRRGARCGAERCRIEGASPGGKKKDAHKTAADLEPTRAEVLVRKAVASDVENRSKKECGAPRAAGGACRSACRHVEGNDHAPYLAEMLAAPRDPARSFLLHDATGQFRRRVHRLRHRGFALPTRRCASYTREVSDRRYSTAAWQRVRRAILYRDGYECLIQGPRCRGYASTVHHIVPSSQRPDLFWEPGNLAAACTRCNYGGGRRVAHENTRTRIAELERIIHEQDQRIAHLVERLREYEPLGPVESRPVPQPAIY